MHSVTREQWKRLIIMSSVITLFIAVLVILFAAGGGNERIIVRLAGWSLPAGFLAACVAPLCRGSMFIALALALFPTGAVVGAIIGIGVVALC
jgi:hypothetical protein